MSNIGFIGLGNMGGPMARNLVKAGHALKVFDLVQASVDALVEAGATAAGSTAAAATDVDAVVTMLPAGPHVRSVYMEDGKVIESAAKGTLDDRLHHRRRGDQPRRQCGSARGGPRDD